MILYRNTNGKSFGGMIVKALLGAAFFTLHSSFFISCKPDTEDVFGEQAAIRLQQSVAEYTTLLKSNTQGWAMDYYPGDLSRGGIAYTALFTDAEVTLRCERAIDYADHVANSEYKYAAAQAVSSSYTIKSETGVVLSFDSFNALIHYWSQPFGTQENALYGLRGDYEFTFVSVCADSVVLRGKRYGNLMRLYPLKESASSYLSRVMSMRTQLSAIPRKRIVVDGKTTAIEMMDNHLKYSDNGTEVDIPYIYTAEGVRFYHHIGIGNVNINQVAYDAASQQLRSADGRVVMPPPSAIEKFVGTSSQWHFGVSLQQNGSTYKTVVADGTMAQDLADIINQAVKTNTNAKYGFGINMFSGIYIGRNLADVTLDANRVVIGWVMRGNYGASATDDYLSYGIAFNNVAGDDNTVTITPTEPGYQFSTNNFWQPFVDYVGRYSPYTVAFDNANDPTTATLTSEADASKWFRLEKK